MYSANCALAECAKIQQHFCGLSTKYMQVLSVVVATVMGNSYHVWSYVWGIIYGEYKGASAKTYAILAGGVALHSSTAP